MGQGGQITPDMLQQLMAAQNPQQAAPTAGGQGMLNSYNNNPYQQNQMGGMGYGMMNQIMAKLQNPQAMQNPMANPMFTSGPGYQSPMMQPNFNYGANMSPIAGQPSPYGFALPTAPKAPVKQTSNGPKGGKQGGK